MMPKWTKDAASPARIAFLIFDQFSNLCLANCLEPLRAANTLSPSRVFDWQILTMDGAEAVSSSQMQVLPHDKLSALTRCDYLFVLASYAHETHDTPATRRALRAAASRADICVGLDSAPWLLASAGLLEGRRATVHWDLLDGFLERFLGVEAERSRVVRDGPILTCAGAMSALDMTLGLIADHAGLALRLDVEALFMQGDPPLGTPQERGALTDTLVRRALAMMRQNLEQPLSLLELSRALSCQARTLDRRCRSALGAPPGTVYRHLRLSSARKMLEGSTLGIAEIALRSGYESPAAMTRAMKRYYGTTPSNLRREEGN